MFRQMKTNEVALLLHGLRAVYVADEVKTHAKLTKMLEGELASRGVGLDDGSKPKGGKTEIKTIYGQIEGVVARAMAVEGKVNLVPTTLVPETHQFNEAGVKAECAVVFTPEAENEFDRRVAELRA